MDGLPYLAAIKDGRVVAGVPRAAGLDSLPRNLPDGAELFAITYGDQHGPPLDAPRDARRIGEENGCTIWGVAI